MGSGEEKAKTHTKETYKEVHMRICTLMINLHVFRPIFTSSPVAWHVPVRRPGAGESRQ